MTSIKIIMYNTDTKRDIDLFCVLLFISLAAVFAYLCIRLVGGLVGAFLIVGVFSVQIDFDLRCRGVYLISNGATV